MKIINGIKHSQNLIESVKELVLKSEKLNKRKPCIAVILIGANSASEIYVKNKIKRKSKNNNMFFFLSINCSISCNPAFFNNFDPTRVRFRNFFV